MNKAIYDRSKLLNKKGKVFYHVLVKEKKQNGDNEISFLKRNGEM